MALAAGFALGIAMQGTKICVDALVQGHTDDVYRGRAMSFYDLLFNLTFVAAAGAAAPMLPDDGYSPAAFAVVALVYLATGLAYRPPILVVAPPPVTQPAGPLAPKFAGGNARCTGLADALADVCMQTGCAFFDAGGVVAASAVDGVHLDADAHRALGMALAEPVRRLAHA